MMVKRLHLLSSFFFVLVVLNGCGLAGGEDGERTIALETCPLPGAVEAQCGSLTVPENRSISDGRILNLNIAVIPATSSFPEPDPLFMLAGGPGQAATEVFGPYIALLENLNENHDIVLNLLSALMITAVFFGGFYLPSSFPCCRYRLSHG